MKSLPTKLSPVWNPEQCHQCGGGDCHRVAKTYLGDHKSQPNVDRIVNTKTDGEDNVDAGDDVDGDPPEVEEADNVCEGDDDDADDVDADADVGKEEEGDDGDGSDGEPDVPPKLKADDLVRLPGRVDLAVNRVMM